MPSVLAIRDLRRRIVRARKANGGDTSLTQLLALDPLSVLRALRAAVAPVYRVERQNWTVGTLVTTLGPALGRRILDVSTSDVTGTTAIRRLWLHAVATAHAARMLAQSSGLLDPEEAWLLGLLHDVPLWLDNLSRRQRGVPVHAPMATWARQWNLPRGLAEVIDRLGALRQSRHGCPKAEDPASLLCAAEFMAEIADFGHEDAADPARELLLASADRSEFLAAQRLRREVEATLRDCGLDLTLPEPDLDVEHAHADEDLSLFSGRQHGDLAQVVLSLLSCSKSASYRGIVTAVTAAALRYMSYDRAWYVKWIKDQNRFVIRAKADLSSRKVVTAPHELAAAEAQVLDRALRDERPVRLDAQEDRGLLHLIGADEALAVPINRDFQTPAFLVLDRQLSTRPIQLLQDSEVAITLGMTATLLNENLLLKRRRQRALKFAVTDPLTRLFNRRMGISVLEQEIARATRLGSPLTVLMLDLDNFKRLNDTHGHVQGDAALRATAEVLRKTLRKEDTICRYGGEEFLVVLPTTEPEDAAILAARLFTAVEQRGMELNLPTTVSIGIAALRSDDTVISVLHRADQALYASKSQGRNRFSIDVDSV
ncbi:MAG: diguanylate cyclase [Planctomycetes bacterium]|nr:diguanylate cyclase [Planctomycetota bacterium]